MFLSEHNCEIQDCWKEYQKQNRRIPMYIHTGGFHCTLYIIVYSTCLAT